MPSQETEDNDRQRLRDKTCIVRPRWKGLSCKRTGLVKKVKKMDTIKG